MLTWIDLFFTLFFNKQAENHQKNNMSAIKDLSEENGLDCSFREPSLPWQSVTVSKDWGPLLENIAHCLQQPVKTKVPRS